MQSGFHVQDGLYFQREKNGNITIVAHESAKVDAKVVFKTTFSRAGFSSVIASMSARGETGETFGEAEELLARK